jgi:hypothetical protein
VPSAVGSYQAGEAFSKLVSMNSRPVGGGASGAGAAVMTGPSSVERASQNARADVLHR